MKPIDWLSIDHFTPDEFADPNYADSGPLISPLIVYPLNDLRHNTGWPIITHAAVGGCVDVDGSHGHAKKSLHLMDQGAMACDFHFNTDADPREQYRQVEAMGFGGVGIYYDWHWDGQLLGIGFHVDQRSVTRLQRWVRRNGEYVYLLGRM